MRRTLEIRIPSPGRIGGSIGPDWLRRLPSLGGGTVVLCFFLPWILVSCGANPNVGIEASGFELATGNIGDMQGISDLGSLFGGVGSEASQTDASPILWLIPLFGLLGLAALGEGKSGAPWALAGGAIGMIGLVIFAVGVSSQGDQAALVGFQVKYRIGYWGSWLGFLIQAGAAALALRQPAVGASVSLGAPGAAWGPPPSAQVEGVAPPAAGPPLGVLEFTSGPLAGRRVPVHKPDFLIGRSSDCDLQLKDSTVSRHHARLRFAQGVWFIQDQGSSGGTYVNSDLIQAARLEVGDNVGVGGSTLVLRLP